jgi:hypothetical protein
LLTIKSMKSSSFRRLMLLVSLLAAMAATPLRQAEAASDMARGVAEGDEDHSVEPLDGGVGDDSDATIRADDPADSVPVARESTHFAAACFVPESSSLRLVSLVSIQPPRSPGPSARRLAILQKFRF